jgi:hypothetical protein
MTLTAIQDQFLLIAGSASSSCPTFKLEVAHAFVQSLTRQVLEAGGGVVVFASGEPTNQAGVPLIFDWTVIRELDNYLNLSSAPMRRCVVVVTSPKAWSSKLSEEQRQKLSKLSEAGAAEFSFVDDAIHTGGNIGDEQVAAASAMVAIGGGKGVTDRAHKMMRKSCPVLPMWISL